MHRKVTARLKENRYYEAIEAARSWIECTSYPQLAEELARLREDERAPLVTLLRDVLLLGGPLGGPLWGAPVLLHYSAPGRSEVLLAPPEAPPADVVRAGWLPATLLAGDEPLGFACKPTSLALATGEMSAAVLVLQTEDTEVPELDDGHLADVVSPATGERVVLCGRFVLPWIEALEAARVMLQELRRIGAAADGPRTAGAQPIFLLPRTEAWAIEAAQEFARIVRTQAADAAEP